jgi:hypothetical protein
MTRYVGHSAMTPAALEALASSGLGASVVDCRGEQLDVTGDVDAGDVLAPFGFRPVVAEDDEPEASSKPLPDPGDRIGMWAWLVGHRVGVGFVVLIDGRRATEAEIVLWNAARSKDIRRASKLRRAVDKMFANVEPEEADGAGI